MGKQLLLEENEKQKNKAVEKVFFNWMFKNVSIIDFLTKNDVCVTYKKSFMHIFEIQDNSVCYCKRSK